MNPVAIIERRPLVWLALLIVFFFWRFSFSAQFTFLESPDQAFQVLPWYQVQARAWNEGQFPMWDPYVWAGQPLLGQMQPGAAFPLNWPLFAMPLDDGFIQIKYINWHFVLMHLLAGFFCYWLARELEASRFAAVMAGMAFACSGYILTINWPQMMHGAIWLPLTLLCFHRAARAPAVLQATTYAALCGGSIGFSILSGHHQTPFFSLLALTGLLAFLVCEKWGDREGQIRFAALFGVAGFVAMLVGAMQLLPAVEYGREALRWVGAAAPVTFEERLPYYIPYELRMRPLHLLSIFFPRTPNFENAHIGVVVAALAVGAMVLGWRSRGVKFYSALAFGSLIYAFGPLTPLHGWIFSLAPQADKARSPGQAVFVFSLAAILLAARGLDLIVDPSATERDSWLRRLAVGLLGVAALAWAIILFRPSDPAFSEYQSDHLALASVACLGAAALLEALRNRAISAPAAQVCLLALMVLQWGADHFYSVVHKSDPNRATWISQLYQHPDVTHFLKQQPGAFRVHFDYRGNHPNLGAWHGIEAVQGYGASVLVEVFDLLGRSGWPQGRRLLNTRYTVTQEPQVEGQESVFEGANGWRVFEDAEARPRAWVEHSLANIAAGESTADELPRPENCSSEDPVEVVERGLQRIVFRARFRCAGYLVVSEPYFPGWVAIRDGERLSIERAYGALRAVYLPAGEHRVVFRYRPRMVFLGEALTGFGILICGFLWWGCRTRQWPDSGKNPEPGSRTESQSPQA